MKADMLLVLCVLVSVRSGRRAEDPVASRLRYSGVNGDINNISDISHISDDIHNNNNTSDIENTNRIINIASVANTSDSANDKMSDKNSDSNVFSDDDFLENNAVVDKTMMSSKMIKNSDSGDISDITVKSSGLRDDNNNTDDSNTTLEETTTTEKVESDLDSDLEKMEKISDKAYPSPSYNYKHWEDFFGNQTTIATTFRPSSCPLYKTSTEPPATRMGMPHHADKQYDIAEPSCLDYYNPVYDMVMRLCGRDFTDDMDLTCQERVGSKVAKSYDPSFGYY